MKKIILLSILFGCSKPTTTTAPSFDYSINGSNYVAISKVIQIVNGSTHHIIGNNSDPKDFSSFNIMVKNDSATVVGSQSINGVSTLFTANRTTKSGIRTHYNIRKNIVKNASGTTINDTFITFKFGDSVPVKLIVNTTI
jgi:hypothetical protein